MISANPEIFPSKEVLQNLETQFTNDFALTFDWHYYKDSKGWLCKVSHKMIPLIFQIKDNKPLNDLYNIVSFKKSAK